MPTRSPHSAVPSASADDDLLASERETLRAKDDPRGRTVIALIESIRLHGFLKTALDVGPGQPWSYTAVHDAVRFARPIAPAHHRRVDALLSILAAACATGDERFAGHFNAPQVTALREHDRRHVTPAARQWARQQLGQPITEQLGLF